MAGEFRLGRASVKITPPGTRVVHDDLYAKALVFEQDGARSAMIVCDLVALRRPVIEAARKQIESITGIPGNRVMITATHTHRAFAPGLLGLTRLDSTGRKAAEEYRASLLRNIGEAVRMAASSLEPAVASAAIGHEPSLVFNRRFLMKDGTVKFNPGFLNPDIVRAVGPVDPEVRVVYFESTDRRPLATLVNYALHLDTVGGNEISADYAYTLSRLLAEVKGPDMLTVFTIGAAGNVNHFDVSRPGPAQSHAEAARIGTVLAAEVLKTYKKLERVTTGPPRTLQRLVPLPLSKITPADVEKALALEKRVGTRDEAPFLEQMWMQRVLYTAERNGKPVEAEVQVFTVGDELAWVGLPGEIFVELGMALKKASPFRFTMVNELANDWLRYIPNRKGYLEGGYEAINTRGAAGSGELLVEAATDLLIEARGR